MSNDTIITVLPILADHHIRRTCLHEVVVEDRVDPLDVVVADRNLAAVNYRTKKS